METPLPLKMYGSSLAALRNNCVQLHNMYVDTFRKGLHSKDPIAQLPRCKESLAHLVGTLELSVPQLQEIFSKLDKAQQEQVLKKHVSFWPWSRPTAHDILEKIPNILAFAKNTLKKFDLAEKDSKTEKKPSNLLEFAAHDLDELNEMVVEFIQEIETLQTALGLREPKKSK